MALDVFSSVRYLLKPEEICIDNWIFKLHYRVTVMLFLGSSAIGVSKQYFGDPINCQTANGVSSKVMDDYCWIHSTFHVRSEYQGNVGCILDTVLAGQNSLAMAAAETPDTAFYQWVPFTLVFQAVLFYLPRKCWRSFEGGLMEAFGKDAKRSILLKSEECQTEIEYAFYRETVAKKYAKFFQSTLHHNNGYFLQFFFCEVFNFLIDLLNIYITNTFLGGRFLRYGPRVLDYYRHSHSLRRDLPNPMCTVFPTVTSCTFHSVGTAAGEQKFNSLCVLSLNIINEKIYILIWFWLFFLTLATALHLVYRITIIIMPISRSLLLMFRARMFRTTDLKTVRRVLSSCYLGDWWVLYQIGRNSNTHFFRYLLRHIELCICAKERQQKSAQVSGVRLKVTNGSGRHRRSHPRGGIDLGSGGNTSYEEEDDDISDCVSGGESGHRSGSNGSTYRGSNTMRKRPHGHGKNGSGNHQKIALAYNV